MQEQLKQFREAAQRDYITICNSLLDEIFLGLDSKALLFYGISKAQEYLPIFESRHPELSWVREFIDRLQKLEAFNHQTVPFTYFRESEGRLIRRHDAPGVWSFLDGLDLLKSALTAYLEQRTQSSLELSGGAVEQFIGARVAEYWGWLHPEEFAAYSEGILTDKDRPDWQQRWDSAIKIYSENVKRKELHLKLLLELADDIELLVPKSNSEDQ